MGAQLKTKIELLNIKYIMQNDNFQEKGGLVKMHLLISAGKL